MDTASNTMNILNLGCGTKTSDRPEVTNIDWSIYLRLKRLCFIQPLIPIFFRGKRLTRYKGLPNNITIHNLARGIPYKANTIDAVYHSHLLEHLDQTIADQFLSEALRVLKPGGIHRIVVPDLEMACRAYIAHIDLSLSNAEHAKTHNSFIAPLIEQSVRKEAAGSSQQPPLRRKLENLLLGDARKRGETHQWMYDRISLTAKLLQLGYKEVTVQSYNTSHIPKWNDYGLDLDNKGNQYRKDSLYIEAIK